MVLKTCPDRIAGRRETTWNFLKHRKYMQKTHTLEEVKAAVRSHEQDRLEHASTHNGATGKLRIPMQPGVWRPGWDHHNIRSCHWGGRANMAPEIILMPWTGQLAGGWFSMAAGAYLSFRSALSSGFEMLLVGVLAAVVAYGAGTF